jgi:lambda repressor-like predicted transcriptional regulator
VTRQPTKPVRHERRLPLAPLLDATGYSYPELSDASGYSAATISSWAARGAPMSAADWMACRCGFHPLNIWPDFMDAPHTTREAEADTRIALF